MGRYFVLNNEHTAQRLKLILATKRLMAKSFELLGIRTLEKI